MSREKLSVILVLILGLAGCTGSVPGQNPAVAPTPVAPAPVAPAAPAAAAAPAETPAVPAPPPSHDGVELEAIAPPGLVRTSIDVNPFKGEARLVFQSPGSQASVHLAVNVHPTVKAASIAVLEIRRTVTGKLVPASNFGLAADSGVAAADADGRVTFAALAQGNVTCVARFVGSPAEAPPRDDASLRAVVAAWTAAVLASPEGSPTPPHIVSVALAPEVQTGSGIALRVSADPAGPGAVFFAYEASDGASIVPSKLGPILYSSKPGPVTVRVGAATSRLAAATSEWQVVVNGPG